MAASTLWKRSGRASRSRASASARSKPKHCASCAIRPGRGNFVRSWTECGTSTADAHVETAVWYFHHRERGVAQRNLIKEARLRPCLFSSAKSHSEHSTKIVADRLAAGECGPIELIVGEQRLGGYCQWVLDVVRQTVEWLCSH